MATQKHRESPGSTTSRLLASLCRAGDDNRALHLGREAAQQQAHACIDHVLERAGLGRVAVNQFRWFVDEVAAALSTDRGLALKFELEQLLAKWRRCTMERNTLELVLRILVRELAGVDVSDEEEQPAKLRVVRQPKRPAAA